MHESPPPEPDQYLRLGCRLMPSTGCHDWPQSSLRKSPAGCVPAYTTPGSDACPGWTFQMLPMTPAGVLSQSPGTPGGVFALSLYSFISGGNARFSLLKSHVFPRSTLL